MPFFKNRPLIVTIVVLVILIVLMAALPGGSDSVLGRVFKPVQEAVQGATVAVGDWFNRISTRSDLEVENASLKEQVAALESQMLNYNELQKENERLKGLLNVKDSVQGWNMVTARVIGKTQGKWYDSFTINVGTDDGIYVNAPVITENGFVGRISEATATYSKVMTISDSSSGVSAIIERTRENCVVRGNMAEDGTMYIKYLSSESNVLPGDRVLTSGMDNLFPKGLVIGEITEVSKDDTTNEKVVSVQSSVNFDTLEEVIVLTEVKN